MLLRAEAPADILSIDRLVKICFETPAESELVMRLRENGNSTLSLVASNDDGEVLGHLMFSPVTVNGQDHAVQGLAPLCVHPDYRLQGIGRALVQEGLAILAELGYPACVVLGDPKYYQHFGFQSASQFSLTCPWDVPEGVFMGQILNPLGFSNQTGLVEYSQEFSLV